ncbi:DinB family protein [Paenibacillus aquistagni]|uniref:DinB family protein n=1 Tax=Paenibacillus aquistagni TaxID=1852522 RepID=UPI00145B3239|nr:DinB family protein [Paenibacillus aquistagni]NMM52889.1 DinB family protein [Paenibacillus aquistagni]
MDILNIKLELTDTRAELLALIHGLNKAQINKKRSDDRWSIGQICEHLAKTEETYVYVIRKGISRAEDSTIEAGSLNVMLDRSKKWQAPDIVVPSSDIFDHDDLVSMLNHSRKKLFELLDSLDDPTILSKRHFSHPVFQDLLLIEWIKSIPLHEKRHMEQIKEELQDV